MNMHTFFRASACLTLFASAIFSSAMADTLTINPTADAFIRASQNASQTLNTTNVIFLVGDTTTANDYLRGLLSFDLSSSALVGATINSVTLTLKINSADASSAGQDVILNLYSLTNTFSEGTVTWTQRNGSSTWTTPGGDYGDLLAGTTANAGTATAGQSVTFSGSDLTDYAISSVGGSLYLLIKLADEDTAQRNVFRFGTVNGTSAYYPVLTIDYTAAVIPEPSTAALLGGLAVLGLACRRPRRSR